VHGCAATLKTCSRFEVIQQSFREKELHRFFLAFDGFPVSNKIFFSQRKDEIFFVQSFFFTLSIRRDFFLGPFSLMEVQSREFTRGQLLLGWRAPITKTPFSIQRFQYVG
jgi:hypothetical protein